MTLPVSKSTLLPVTDDWTQAYQNLPQQTFEFYQSKSTKKQGSHLKQNVMALLVGSGLAALSSLVIDADFIIYIFAVGFGATRENLTTLYLHDKCTLQINPGYLTYTFDQVTKKIYLDKLVKMKLTKNAMILKADYGQLGVRTYKFLLKDNKQHKMSDNTKNAMIDFIETVIAVNRAAKNTKK